MHLIMVVHSNHKKWMASDFYPSSNEKRAMISSCRLIKANWGLNFGKNRSIKIKKQISRVPYKLNYTKYKVIEQRINT